MYDENRWGKYYEEKKGKKRVKKGLVIVGSDVLRTGRSKGIMN